MVFMHKDEKLIKHYSPVSFFPLGQYAVTWDGEKPVVIDYSLSQKTLVKSLRQHRGICKNNQKNTALSLFQSGKIFSGMVVSGQKESVAKDIPKSLC